MRPNRPDEIRNCRYQSFSVVGNGQNCVSGWPIGVGTSLHRNEINWPPLVSLHQIMMGNWPVVAQRENPLNVEEAMLLTSLTVNTLLTSWCIVAVWSDGSYVSRGAVDTEPFVSLACCCCFFFFFFFELSGLCHGHQCSYLNVPVTTRKHQRCCSCQRSHFGTKIPC